MCLRNYHCYYDCYRKDFIVQKDVEYWGNTENNQLVPATKEQRDLLFKKMHETSYEWDEDKKELRKIENQGEQKPIIDRILTVTNYDKMFQNCNVHKFKVGDWIISKYMHLIMQISNNDNGCYENVEIDGTKRNDSYDFIERNFKLWTIQDAKVGDVLVVNNEVFLYAYRKQMYSIVVAHCFVDSAGGFYFNGEFGYTEKGNSIHPATKEQRELLFQKMEESGYEWDVCKKKLRKINDKLDPLIDEEIDLWIQENRNIHHDDNNIVELMRDMAYYVATLTRNLYGS